MRRVGLAGMLGIVPGGTVSVGVVAPGHLVVVLPPLRVGVVIPGSTLPAESLGGLELELVERGKLLPANSSSSSSEKEEEEEEGLSPSTPSTP